MRCSVSFVNIFLSVVLALILVSCGGGGGGGSNGGGSSSISSQLCSGSFQALSVGSSINSNVSFDETQCYSFAGVQGQTYSIDLDNVSGDPDIAAHKNTNLDAESVVVYSLLDSNLDEEVMFTARSSQQYYIEIYGTQAGSYTLNLQVEDISSVLNTDSIEFSSVVDTDLPANQEIVAPVLTPQTLNVSVIDSYSQFVIDSRIDNSQLPVWLSIQKGNISRNGNSVEYQMTLSASDIGLTAGTYNFDARFYYKNISIDIYKDIDVTYNLYAAPTISANQPAEINHGVLSSFTISSVHPSNIPASYSLNYGPSGMSVNNDGLVNVFPAMPMFKKELAVHWGFLATFDVIQMLYKGEFKVKDDGRKSPIARSGFEFDPSGSNSTNSIIGGDFDKDGIADILAVAENNLLYTIEKDGDEYVQDWLFPFSLGEGVIISDIAIYDVNQDGDEDAVVALTRGDGGDVIVVLDRQSNEIIYSFESGFKGADSLNIGDINNDGVDELVFLGITDTFERHVVVYRLDNMTLVKHLASDIGFRIKVGNVDSDSSLEIVAGSGRVLDGSSYSIEWEIGDDLRSFLLGDVDGDGVDEIISGFGFRLYSGISKSLIYENDSFQNNMTPFIVNDIDADSANEIVYQVGAYSFNSASMELEEDWFANLASYRHLVYFDIDNDGSDELAYTVGTGSGRQFTVSDISSGLAVEWQDTDPLELQGNFRMADWITTNEGANEKAASFITFVQSTGNVYLINMEIPTGRLNVKKPNIVEEYTVTNDWKHFVTFDWDNDGVDEHALTRLTSSGQAVHIYDNENDSIDISSLNEISMDGILIDKTDFTGDDIPEVIILSDFLKEVYIFDMTSGQNIAQIALPESSDLRDMFIRDVDNDGDQEILVLQSDTATVIETKTGYSVDRTFELSPFWYAFADDVNNDGNTEIIFTYTDNGDVKVINMQGEQLAGYQLGVSAKPVGSYHEGGARNIIFALDDTTLSSVNVNYFAAVDYLSGEEVWLSPGILGSIDNRKSVNFVDINGDGYNEIIFSTNNAIYATQ